MGWLYFLVMDIDKCMYHENDTRALDESRYNI